MIYTISGLRMIISRDISTKLSAKIRLKSIERAIDQQFKVKLNKTVDLVVDGGSENNNKVIHNFIQKCQVDIKKKIALKDIVQSNSMVEASYRCLKSHFLYGKQIQNTKELIKYVDFYYDDHDRVKPHSAHVIYTPDEVYFGNNPDFDLKQIYKNAALQRRITNKNGGCGVC